MSINVSRIYIGCHPAFADVGPAIFFSRSYWKTFRSVFGNFPPGDRRFVQNLVGVTPETQGGRRPIDAIHSL